MPATHINPSSSLRALVLYFPSCFPPSVSLRLLVQFTFELVPALVPSAASVTFYGVSQEVARSTELILDTISIPAGPVGVDGVITYVEEDVVSFWAEELSDTTEVIVSTPTTFFFAIAESTGGDMASAYAVSGSSTIELNIESCTFDATGHGVCVD
ncbi:hypothetical protein C8F01DRAFT_1173164, partial [Mycena amicta]